MCLHLITQEVSELWSQHCSPHSRGELRLTGSRGRAGEIEQTSTVTVDNRLTICNKKAITPCREIDMTRVEDRFKAGTRWGLYEVMGTGPGRWQTGLEQKVLRAISEWQRWYNEAQGWGRRGVDWCEGQVERRGVSWVENLEHIWPVFFDLLKTEKLKESQMSWKIVWSPFIWNKEKVWIMCEFPQNWRQSRVRVKLCWYHN